MAGRPYKPHPGEAGAGPREAGARLQLRAHEQYPGVEVDGVLTATYTEGLFFGYRWFDAQGTAPLWPFGESPRHARQSDVSDAAFLVALAGHGLSYTTFKYSNLAVSGSVSPSSNATVSFDLSNAGAVAGAEVAQLYVGFPIAAAEPPRLLRDFAKVQLAPGESRAVPFTLSAGDLSVWDEVAAGWRLVTGTFGLFVGSSSRDLRLEGSLVV